MCKTKRRTCVRQTQNTCIFWERAMTTHAYALICLQYVLRRSSCLTQRRVALDVASICLTRCLSRFAIWKCTRRRVRQLLLRKLCRNVMFSLSDIHGIMHVVVQNNAHAYVASASYTLSAITCHAKMRTTLCKTCVSIYCTHILVTRRRVRHALP